MEQFLLVIFWIVVSIYLLRLALRYLFPWLVRRFIQKMVGKMSQQPPANPYTSRKKEGDIYVKTDKDDKPKIDPDIGEYIDFEDIKSNDKNPKT